MTTVAERLQVEPGARQAPARSESAMPSIHSHRQHAAAPCAPSRLRGRGSPGSPGAVGGHLRDGGRLHAAGPSRCATERVERCRPPPPAASAGRRVQPLDKPRREKEAVEIAWRSAARSRAAGSSPPPRRRPSWIAHARPMNLGDRGRCNRRRRTLEEILEPARRDCDAISARASSMENGGMRSCRLFRSAARGLADEIRPGRQELPELDVARAQARSAPRQGRPAPPAPAPGPFVAKPSAKRTCGGSSAICSGSMKPSWRAMTRAAMARRMRSRAVVSIGRPSPVSRPPAGMDRHNAAGQNCGSATFEKPAASHHCGRSSPHRETGGCSRRDSDRAGRRR